MSNRYNHDEYSLRRSINNTLRSKSSFLNNRDENNQNITLKKFVPNIDNLKNENNVRKNDNDNKLEEDEEGLNNKHLEQLIKKTINIDLENEGISTKTTSKNKYNNKEYPSHAIDPATLNNNVNLLNIEALNLCKEESLEKKNKVKTSIDIYELNNISKNIFYNKKCASGDVHFLPLTLPFFNKNEKQKKIRKLLLDKEPFFFSIQLPNMLPALLSKEEEEQNGEQTKNDTKQNDQTEKNEKKKKSIINKSSTNDSYQLSNIHTIPNGKFAKLIIYKNKKIKMKINDILFDINEGSACTFSQEIGCFIKENSEFIFLGNCDYKLVATPNIERIIHKK